ncbi:hypothetical protein Gotur_017536, partial [Gossypium turneri]
IVKKRNFVEGDSTLATKAVWDDEVLDGVHLKRRSMLQKNGGLKKYRKILILKDLRRKELNND